MDDLFDGILGFLGVIIAALLAVELIGYAVSWAGGIIMASFLPALTVCLLALLVYVLLALILASEVIPVLLSVSAGAWLGYWLILESEMSSLVGLAKFHGIMGRTYDAPVELNLSAIGLITALCLLGTVFYTAEWFSKAGNRGQVRLLALPGALCRAIWALVEEAVYVLDRENRGPFRAVFRCCVGLVLVVSAWVLAVNFLNYAFTNHIAGLSSGLLSGFAIFSGVRTWRRLDRIEKWRQ